jgi:hypothetical protein
MGYSDIFAALSREMCVRFRAHAGAAGRRPNLSGKVWNSPMNPCSEPGNARIDRRLFVSSLAGAVLAASAASEAGADTNHNAVTAIDVLLEPDAVMLRHAEANNARLRRAFPQGFALDAAHRPHITMLQRYVRTADLERIYAAARKILAPAQIQAITLEAFKYYYLPGGEIGVAGIVAKPTAALLELQKNLIAAVAPFTVPSGDSSAFVTTPDDPVIDPILIQYVAGFVPLASGEKFSPHVSTGVASRTYLDAMLAEPFEPFTFSVSGAAVYQLGQFGTAARKLAAWK